MSTYRVKRIGVLQTALFVGTAFLVVGVTIGTVITLAGALWGWGTPDASGWRILIAGGFLTIVLWPAYLAVIGFFGGLVFPIIYNAASSLSGGIAVELTEER